MTSATDLTPSGFFAWRTPLLPYAEATALSADLRAPGLLERGGRKLDEAVAADRARVRGRLRALMGLPEVREGIYLASPDLEAAIDRWLQAPNSETSEIEGPLLRYAVRMATRPTPFATFAGCSVGSVGGHGTVLRLTPRAQYRRATRLDMGYLTAVAEAVAVDPGSRGELLFRPNSSLYRNPGQVRFVACRTDGTERSFHLVSLPATGALEAALARAAGAATIEDLATAVAGTGMARDRAEAYVERLVDRQVLVADLGVAVTGPDPLAPLVAELRAHTPTKEAGDTLARVATALARFDDDGVGASPARYRTVAEEFDALPAERKAGREFQLDLVKPSVEARLSNAVVIELARGITLLRQLAQPTSDETALDRFREAFVRRYEDAAVPLVEALDDEAGVGFGGGDPAPLLRGIEFSGSDDDRVRWGAREQWLLRRLLDRGGEPGAELVLSKDDVKALAHEGEPQPLPAALAVTGTVVGTLDELASDRFEVILTSVSGPSGAKLLGRFCAADPGLEAAVRNHLRAEEQADPDAVFAEVVHLPEGRLGNVLARPVLRDAEIPYLGVSGAPDDDQLPVTDLLVSVRGDRIELRSSRLGRRVVPRLTTAHNFLGPRSLPLYRFLCLLQHDKTAELTWQWGPLAGAPFLPRVRCGRLVLALARWTLDSDDLRRLGNPAGAKALGALRELRERRGIPRWVRLVDGDNRLLVDLDNVVSVESLLGLVHARDHAVLEEAYPSPERLGATGPEGRFSHEVVVPFVRKAATDSKPRRHQSRATVPATARTVPPTDNCLYVKLYCGQATADDVLREAVAPVARRLVDDGPGDRWFFLRYLDPDPHLRVRIHGDPAWLHEVAWPALSQALVSHVDNGQVWRIALDTYRPELHRYGGTEAIEVAERLFHADSVAVAHIVARLSRGDEGRTERWQLTLRGTHLLLAGLGFDLGERRDLARVCRDDNRREHRLEDGAARRPIGRRFRELRTTLDGLLAPEWDDDHPLAPGFEALAWLAEAAAAVGAELRALDAAGRLTVSLEEIARSFCHMHANRLLRASHRRQEAVLWDFLTRVYDSQAHCSRGHTTTVSTGNDGHTAKPQH